MEDFYFFFLSVCQQRSPRSSREAEVLISCVWEMQLPAFVRISRAADPVKMHAVCNPTGRGKKNPTTLYFKRQNSTLDAHQGSWACSMQDPDYTPHLSLSLLLGEV